MGDEAELSIERLLAVGYLEPLYYEWKHEGDSRVRRDGRCSPKVPPHAHNCRCQDCIQLRTECVLSTNAQKRVSVEQAFKQPVPFDVPTHIVCKRCQATGLHWGLNDGKPELREEGGWPHKCKKIEGVTLNLPNIFDPQ